MSEYVKCPKCKKIVKPDYKFWCYMEFMGYKAFCPKCGKLISQGDRIV